MKINQSVKKKRLILTFFVLFSMFISENVLAQNNWTKNYVQVKWSTSKNCIEIRAIVYDYIPVPEKSEYGYLEECEIEASTDNMNYYKLMDIHTQRQKKSKYTTTFLKNKLDNAQIHIFNNTPSLTNNKLWPESAKSNIKVMVSNVREEAKGVLQELAWVDLGWFLDIDSKDVQYIRIKGIWHLEYLHSWEVFKNFVYKINRPGASKLKSNTQGINATVSKSDTAKVFKTSEAIVIEGADSGKNIKVYTTSGVEIKSVISNNDVVKIKLPVKQIYLVHVGELRYKVAM